MQAFQGAKGEINSFILIFKTHASFHFGDYFKMWNHCQGIQKQK